MKNLKIRGCALLLALTTGFTCCGCSLKGKITSSKNTIYESTLEDSSTLSSYLESSAKNIKFDTEEYIGESGYDKLNISFKDMDTIENIKGISATIVDKDGNILNSFSSDDEITTIDDFKYGEIYTIIEEQVNNKNYEKFSSYSFCLTKPNAKEEETYNSAVIFKESKIYNKTRQEETGLDLDQYLYSEFQFDSMTLDDENMEYLQEIMPNIKDKLGSDKINVGIINLNEDADVLITGGYYEIRDSLNNKVVATFIGKNEIQTIKGLKPGNYILKEVIAPDGCYNDKNMYQFTIDDIEEEYNVLYIYKDCRPKETLSSNNILGKKLYNKEKHSF